VASTFSFPAVLVVVLEILLVLEVSPFLVSMLVCFLIVYIVRFVLSYHHVVLAGVLLTIIFDMVG